MNIKDLFRRGRQDQRPESPENRLRIVFTDGEDGYIIAECPQLPGCMSQGRTKKEALTNIADAIKSIIAVRVGQFIGHPPGGSSAGREDENTLCVKQPELTCV